MWMYCNAGCHPLCLPSAGVGRTGTLIALDLAMQQAVDQGQLDVMELVRSLRDQRCLMVQAPVGGSQAA